MEDPYQYPVFFECANLSAEQRKKIENHFQIRRKSGGGECSPVTNVDDKVCRVSFKEREAQQRVLQRCEHVLEFAGGPLVLRVRGSPGDDSSSDATSNLASSSQEQKQDSSLASNVPPSGEEYERQLDGYLLRYLKEFPNAEKELEKELALVSCSAQLYPDEGRVLVRRSAQPGDVDEVSDWKAEVDKFFDDYLCHYELDFHKVKVLLQSCITGQTTDEVKVYSEVGMAVVVGKLSQVKARLANVEDCKGKHRGSSFSEEQTTVRRLGEAKLRLLWREIRRSLGQNLPRVKVTQGEAGQLVLAGSVQEILKAGELISEEENLVLERTISDKSPHFLAFLRKVYGDPGVLRDFLGVGNEVEVELRDTELHFLAFSDAKLDYIEKKMQEKFKDVKFDLPNCSIVPLELREMLRSKTNEMNQGQCKAQVVFGSDSTVSLLGHTNQVEELSDTVTQFILDQVSVEGKVILPFPELVQLLPELLQLHKFDHSGVTLYPLTSSSGPMVVLEGPANRVTEVRNRLGPLLDSLVQHRVTIDLPAAVRYFESPSGRDSILSVTQSKKCLMQLKELPHASRQNSGFGKYSLCGGLQVLVCEGDITKQNVDALVNAANEDLQHHGGVAAALSKAGGPEVQKECKDIVKRTGKIRTGDVVVSTGGNLKCKKLLHAVGPVGGKASGREMILLEQAVQKALNLSEMMEFQSIAIPCISSGLFGVPVTVCSEAIVTAVKKFGSQGGRSLSKIILIDKRAEVVRAMKEACDRLLQGMSTGNSTGLDVENQMDAAGQDSAAGATAGTPGGSVHVEIIQGTIEAQQVDALVSPMVDDDPLSTRVGNTLYKRFGSKLTARFKEEAGSGTSLTDAVLVEGLPGSLSNAVFFLSLAPWDDDQNGTAVEVLRTGISNILTSCEDRGFGSVAFPALGVGIALRFPPSVVARVLLEQIHAFERDRASSTPLLVRIVIYPSDIECNEAFESVQEALKCEEFTADAQQQAQDQVSTTKRIVLLGKTGSGKSHLANTIFGENLFGVNHSPNSGTSKCQSETKVINDRSVTLIDTPGFFDTGRPQEDLKAEIVRCITECAPGPHAFLIVLKMEKFSEHEQAVISKICQYFSEDALNYAAIVFTHGDQLPKGTKIEEFVSQNENLSDLVKKCGGRCHVFDNKHWNNKQQNNYRSNQFQLEELLCTVDEMVAEKNGRCYTNKLLQDVEKQIQEQEENLRCKLGNLPQEEIKKKAKNEVCNRFLIQLAGIGTGALLGAFCGLAAMVGLVITVMRNVELMKFIKRVPALAGAPAAAAAGGEAVVVAGVAVGSLTVAAGGIMGGIIGGRAAEEAETPLEAADRAAEAVWDQGKSLFKKLNVPLR